MTDEGARIDPATVEALYATHAVELRAFLIGVLRDADLAREVIQGTFAKLVELGHTAREETLKGWLFRVAYHEALVLRRRQAVHQKTLARLGALFREVRAEPGQRLTDAEIAAEVRQALDRLSSEQQVVVRMRIYEDKKFAMIATQLGLPLGTVLTRMRAALTNLKRDLQSDE